MLGFFSVLRALAIREDEAPTFLVLGSALPDLWRWVSGLIGFVGRDEPETRMQLPSPGVVARTSFRPVQTGTISPSAWASFFWLASKVRNSFAPR